MLATLTVLTTIPFSMAPAAATSGAIISVDPSLNAGVVGSTFQVTVDLSNQPALVGFDFSLLYNNAVLSCISMDATGSGTVIGSLPPTSHAGAFVIPSCNDPFGTARTTSA